jgi:hypothetical protein
MVEVENLPPENNEQMLLEMANHYKEVYNKLTDEVQELKKLLMMCYTLFRIEDDDDMEWGTAEMGRHICSEAINKYFFDK